MKFKSLVSSLLVVALLLSSPFVSSLRASEDDCPDCEKWDEYLWECVPVEDGTEFKEYVHLGNVSLIPPVGEWINDILDGSYLDSESFEINLEVTVSPYLGMVCCDGEPKEKHKKEFSFNTDIEIPLTPKDALTEMVVEPVIDWIDEFPLGEDYDWIKNILGGFKQLLKAIIISGSGHVIAGGNFIGEKNADCENTIKYSGSGGEVNLDFILSAGLDTSELGKKKKKKKKQKKDDDDDDDNDSDDDDDDGNDSNDDDDDGNDSDDEQEDTAGIKVILTLAGGGKAIIEPQVDNVVVTPKLGELVSNVYAELYIQIGPFKYDYPYEKEIILVEPHSFNPINWNPW